MNPVFIKATNLSDAWFQSIYACVENGNEFIIDEGSFKGQKRLEFDYFTVQITHPDVLPLLPQLRPDLPFPKPVDDDYIDGYLPYLMTDEEKEGESYTYGQRITAATLPRFVPHTDFLIEDAMLILSDRSIGKLNDALDIYPSLLNQMDLMIWTYKHKGYRNNQMIMQVGQGSDMLLKDPPCLRHIDTRIQDGKLHFFPYFRSWDLWGGFPANLAAIELMKQYCAEQIGVGNGEIIASSKGLHLYDYTWELAETIRGRSISEFKKEIEDESKS